MCTTGHSTSFITFFFGEVGIGLIIFFPQTMKGIEAKMEVSCLPAKRDLARIRVIAQARMQFKQLPYALAVNTSTRNSGLTTGEVKD